MKKGIRITATFGSKFQEEFANKSLLLSLKAWVEYLKHSHVKNKVKVEMVDKGKQIKTIDDLTVEWEDS